jgi:hypothetical protein
MQPHEQRVVDEKHELDIKIEKLYAFFVNPIYAALNLHQQDLFQRQYSAMKMYSHILELRIKEF